MGFMLLLATVTTPAFAQCDLIETNHVYNRDGSKRFVQTIFWGYDHRGGGGLHVRAYVYNGRCKMMPVVVRDHRSREWVARWTREGHLYEVRAPSYRETHTTYDVEVLDRKWVPISRRRRLQFGE